MNAKIYVVMHKQDTVPKVEGNYTLFVGANGKKPIYTDYTDDKGDNISDKNPNYCELTGLYWIWKNSDADITGLCHYRRFLTTSRFSNESRFFLTANVAKKLLNDYDIILPQSYVLYDTVKRKINFAPNINDMNEVEEAIRRVTPEYLEDYFWFMSQNKIHLFNIMICKKSLLDNYCSWLFPILKEFDRIHDMSVETGYRARLDGMLSERLLNIWVHHNIPDHKIREMRWVQTDQNNNALVVEIKSFIKEIIWKFR